MRPIERAAPQASTFISPWSPGSSQEPLQRGPRWRGKRGRGQWIGLEGGELHHNATHGRAPLIQRKDRVPIGVCALYKGCAASSIGSTLVAAGCLTQTLARFDRPVRRWL